MASIHCVFVRSSRPVPLGFAPLVTNKRELDKLIAKVPMYLNIPGES